jgi:hypothetical protein
MNLPEKKQRSFLKTSKITAQLSPSASQPLLMLTLIPSLLSRRNKRAIINRGIASYSFFPLHS